MDAPLRLPPPAPSLAHRYRRLPAIARVGLYMLACVSASLAWCALLFLVLRPGPEVFQSPERFPLASHLYLAGTYMILVAGALWAWRRGQGESLRTLGLKDRRAPGRLAAGAWWGLGSLGMLFGFELAIGLVVWDPAAWEATPWAIMAATAATALFFGFSEELLFRGFVFQTLRRGLPLGAAVTGSAAFYASCHFLRFDRPFWAVALPWLGLFLAGAVLAWATHRTRSIWLAVGLHASWVYLFVLTDRQKLLIYPIDHNLWSGGGYPLQGLLGLFMLLLLGLTLAWRLSPGRKREKAPGSPEA